MSEFEPHTHLYEHKPRTSKQEILESDLIEEFRLPLENILHDLKERIEKGDYSLIIGDDASGRLPARTIYEFMKLVYDKNNREHPRLHYIAGTGGYRSIMEDLSRNPQDKYYQWVVEKRELVRRFIRTVKKSLSEREDGSRGRALIVT